MVWHAICREWNPQSNQKPKLKRKKKKKKKNPADTKLFIIDDGTFGYKILT